MNPWNLDDIGTNGHKRMAKTHVTKCKYVGQIVSLVWICPQGWTDSSIPYCQTADPLKDFESHDVNVEFRLDTTVLLSECNVCDMDPKTTYHEVIPSTAFRTVYHNHCYWMEGMMKWQMKLYNRTLQRFQRSRVTCRIGRKWNCSWEGWVGLWRSDMWTSC